MVGMAKEQSYWISEDSGWDIMSLGCYSVSGLVVEVSTMMRWDAFTVFRSGLDGEVCAKRRWDRANTRCGCVLHGGAKSGMVPSLPPL